MSDWAVPEKDERDLALVVVDMQNKFFAGADAALTEERTRHLQGIAKAVDMFHAAGRQVIFVLYDGVTHYMDGNTAEGDAIVSGIDARPDDIYVHKYHMNSFLNTCLEDAVRSMGCDTVLLCGMITEFCVMATYWGASDHRLSAFLMKDALISSDPKHTPMFMELCRNYDFGELELNLSKTHPEKPKDPLADYIRKKYPANGTH
ncbi:hypothetical protein AUQ37_04985 [Candidatus Methanomethylophilus sp. 1R26]|jgi:nicotinamidase-related amidase|nr:hypothetical protein AUQ37_04985 [Candidatus Methanomethylophilus sp. 1R26]MCH3977754.1 cysteine hydrolase [Methanomethylophilus sp.]TQS79049.1 MAG: hypothetical protein A3Q59_01755 [Methanomethylophilus alvi]